MSGKKACPGLQKNARDRSRQALAYRAPAAADSAVPLSEISPASPKVRGSDQFPLSYKDVVFHVRLVRFPGSLPVVPPDLREVRQNGSWMQEVPGCPGTGPAQFAAIPGKRIRRTQGKPEKKGDSDRNYVTGAGAAEGGHRADVRCQRGKEAFPVLVHAIVPDQLLSFR